MYWVTRLGRWQSAIQAQGKKRTLGSFRSEVEAAQAYDAAARRYFGKHAWLNFPDEGELGGAQAPSPETPHATMQRAAA